MTRIPWKLVLPLAVVLVGIGATLVMIRARPQVETRPTASVPPLVRVLQVHPETVQLRVYSQGSVVPRTETTLAPQVPGRVVDVSPQLVAGGFVRNGEVLIEVDRRDYELAVVRARSEVARAEVRVAREEAEAAVARDEWQELGSGDPPPLASREAQLVEARANLDAACAMQQQAEVDLQRTRLVAPFDGRVRDENVDVGQFVGIGQSLARLYAIDVAEVRLPLPDDELAFMDMPLGFRDPPAAPTVLPRALLRTRFAGSVHEWQGRVVRTEGEIDPLTRMVNVVVQVQDPYAPSSSNRPPLAVGMFVEAEIVGRTVDNVFVVPRAAVRGRDRLLVVDRDDRLRFRTVVVLRNEGERAIIASGLEAGERVCLSPLAVVTDGMRVRTTEDVEVTP